MNPAPHIHYRQPLAARDEYNSPRLFCNAQLVDPAGERSTTDPARVTCRACRTKLERRGVLRVTQAVAA